MKIVLFGTGEYYKRYGMWFDKKDVVALIDNSIDKQGTMIDGLKVVSPKYIMQIRFDVVFIMSFYVKEMRQQLIELGVEYHKIYHFYDIHDFYSKKIKKKEIFIFEKDSEYDRGDFLLLNQDLTLGGPALALFEAAKILKQKGFKVVYASQIDGPLRKLLLEEEITVVVDNNLLVQTMDECHWIKEFSTIICNTINFHVFISSRRTIKNPIIWWLHDALFFYDGVNSKAIKSIINENIKIWTVGSIAKKAICTYRPDFKVENLLYGVEDKSEDDSDLTKNVSFIQFIIVGYIESRKGQDVLIEAIKDIPKDILKHARFRFVGCDSSEFAKKIKVDSMGISEIEFLGMVDRRTINSLFSVADVLICPSREDPMPTVCAEAMMHGIFCIVSSVVGTSEYIKDNYSGMIFESENANDLSKKIIWVINNKQNIKKMGNNARKIYEKYFSMNAFESRFLELLSIEESDIN